MPFKFKDTGLKDAKIVQPQVFEDERGFFMETFVEESFRKNGIATKFVQESHSKSENGVLRGIHYQKGETAQGKLVRVTEGAIMDVIADLRTDSETFGETESVILSEHNKKIIWIPRGFGHGFYTISETAEIQYKADNKYAPNQEGGIIWNDPTLDIDWPVDSPKISDKDKDWPTLQEAREEDLLF